MSRLAGLVLALAALALPAKAAEEIVLGMSSDTISITTNFDGSDILVFGAIKRESPIPEEPLDVIVTVSGPLHPVTVRYKERRAGIWVNTEAVDIDAAPSYYAVQTSGPMKEILYDTEDLRHSISIPRAIRSVGAPMDVQDSARFTQALVRIRTGNRLYQLNEGAVSLDEETLFRTSVRLPANLTEGGYPTRIFLLRNKSVVATHERIIEVRKVGLERWLFTLSRQQPLIYGLLSLAIAIAAGWGASAAFKVLRRG